jgi:DNA polymerase-3 subunit gamma/tau
MSIPLINKYRPESFDEMIGHATIKAAIQRVIGSDSQPHSYLLTGPGGIGKTSTARIIGKMLGCEIIEFSASEKSGADDMRDVVNLGAHMALSGAGLRMIIIDECHGLSKQAWDVLLKLLEEPPDHLYLALCTTEPSKVKDTIMQRCFHIPLKPLSVAEIEELLLSVIAVEEWVVDADVFNMVLGAAKGSPRKALTLLQTVWDAPSKEEASRIIDLHDGSEPLLELCRHLTAGAIVWDKAKGYLERIEDTEWDNAYLLIGRFIAGAMLKTKSAAEAERLWKLLDALTFPVETVDRKVAFYAAFGKMIWGA